MFYDQGKEDQLRDEEFSNNDLSDSQALSSNPLDYSSGTNISSTVRSELDDCPLDYATGETDNQTSGSKLSEYFCRDTDATNSEADFSFSEPDEEYKPENQIGKKSDADVDTVTTRGNMNRSTGFDANLGASLDELEKRASFMMLDEMKKLRERLAQLEERCETSEMKMEIITSIIQRAKLGHGLGPRVESEEPTSSEVVTTYTGTEYNSDDTLAILSQASKSDVSEASMSISISAGGSALTAPPSESSLASDKYESAQQSEIQSSEVPSSEILSLQGMKINDSLSAFKKSTSPMSSYSSTSYMSSISSASPRL